MKLKFGMVGGGGGGIGPMHIRGANMDFMGELAAGCFSRTPEKNEYWAEVWGVRDRSRVYPDYATMAASEGARSGDDRLDYIIIVTPNDSHFEIAKLFMEQGFHIICDKPLASTVEQGEALALLANERGLLFGLTYTYAGYAMIRQARELIDQGELGDLVYINAEYPQEWLALALVENSSANATWRLDPDRAGESQATADIGTHCEYLIKAVTGLSPERVLAKFDHIPRVLPLESTTTILLEYPGQVTGLIWASQFAIGHECDIRIRVFGTKGSIDWSHQNAGTLKVARLSQPVQFYTAASTYNYPEANRLSRTNPGHPEGLFEAFGNIYRSFCEHVLAQKEARRPESFTYATVEDGLAGMKFIHACVESNQNGNCWVKL